MAFEPTGSGWARPSSLRLLVVGSLFLAAASSARAADLIISDGEVIGATGVMVLGQTYDVSFVDGSCIDVFDPCTDAALDFPFDLADSLAASEALRDVINATPSPRPLPDSYRGCSDSGCTIKTPGALVAADDVLAYAAAIGSSGQSNLSSDQVGRSYDDIARTYAVWTAVPSVPLLSPLALSALMPGLLVGLGLAALRKRV